ncbi:MAG TPA: gliding motility lipoprotein GldD [Flavobacteriaceae bacterium]|jgi:gliding motility-associated lipoprotein GldD|nr:gliding motility lipoprotein GldD [Flavobacteriaceae bacterium]HBS11174.1 gliding motility lipoprotein GldD [Flavobacteriaceae bacterium]
MNKITLKILFVIFISLPISSCGDSETLPKPKAFLNLTYSDATYITTDSNCPYTFNISSDAKYHFTEKCWVNISYPKLKASINITYRKIDNNLNELLRESEKLTYNHAIKADLISAPSLYDNFENKTYGSLSEVTGNAASPLQFHITDSTKHFITGAVYFKVQPNYDSILPAIKYIEKDIKRIMETITWK